MKKTKKSTWFFVSLFAVLLAAPNATVIRHSLSDFDPFMFNVLRFLIVALVTTPFLLKDRHQLERKNFRHALLAGVYISVAVITYTWAIKLSQASYVSIITLITPIIFVVYSTRMTGEKITNRAIAGITLAAIGAFIIVLLPIAIKQDGPFIFYPLASLLVLINCFTFPLSIINYRQSNESGLSMPALMCISSWIVTATNLACALMFDGHIGTISSTVIAGIIYSGVVVALISRIMHVVSYEHIGSAITSILQYLETFIAILLPVILLNEKLSVELIIGGVFILAGVYVVEYHKSAHHKHHYLFRHH